MKRGFVFRATGLPALRPDDKLKEALKAAIDANLSENERSTITIQADIVPSCYDHDGQSVALVEFGGGVPGFLAALTADPLANLQMEMEGDDVNFDVHFFGFTQLYRPKADAHITADVIAITGLDGHAYGSWKGNGNLGRMWLRHFLSKDLPCCRTMIYGYNSKLSSRATNTIMDYGRELLEEIRKIRNTEQVGVIAIGYYEAHAGLTSSLLQLWQRPLFFIAHSFGGIILVHSLVKAAHSNVDYNAALHAIYKATYGMLFFATPHKGLVVSDIRKMLMGQTEHPRNALLNQINEQSDLLDHQLDAFRDIIRDRRIVSFYERGQTRQLEYNSESQRWRRSGDYVTTVGTDSALLQLPTAVEEKIPLSADHSTIVKFDARTDAGYTSARDKLRQYERNASSVVGDRFSVVHAVSIATKPLGNIHWMVPRPVNSLFTGRTQLLQRIESALQNDGASNSRRKQLVITGLGGMGKSEVCLQVANTLRKDFWGVFWVDVGSDTTAKNGFLAIAKALGSFAASIEDSLLALASTQRRWLLILDNADDPELDYSRYFPSGIEGTVLLTSRVPQCSQYSAVLAESLGALDVQHSVQLLLKAARVPEDQWQGCDKQAQDIVHLLGSHTLALIQAGAYIAEGYCSLDQYIAKYQRQRKRLLEHYPIQEQSRYRDVYATFEASAEVLNRDEAGRDALELLEILASLSSSVFPLQLFADAWEQATRVLKPITEWTELGELGRWHALQLPGFVDGKADEWDDYRLKKASALLASLSLVTRNSTGGIDGLSMHPLTHVWARDRLRTQRRQQAWVSAGCTLALSRGRSEPWHPCERELLPHVQSLLASTVETVLTLGSRQEMLTVLVHCGWILDDMREDVRLEALLLEIYEQLQIAPEVPSEEHVAIWDLAGANVMHMGHTGQAVALLKHVVKVRESTLAESHLSRLMSQHGLAEAYIFNKQIMEAIALLEQLVKVEATTLAESHPFRLASQHILAMAYCGNRQMKEALELLPHVVKVREMTLAETHLDRLASQHELARAYHSNGQTKEAVALLEHVVKVQDITLVETHPNRLTSQHELAIVFHTNGQIKEAVTLLEHVVKVREMTLPETHPDQLASQHVLARAYHSNGQTREAVALLEHVVAVEGRILPAGHPSRIASIEELEYIKALEDLKVRWIGDRS